MHNNYLNPSKTSDGSENNSAGAQGKNSGRSSASGSVTHRHSDNNFDKREQRLLVSRKLLSGPSSRVGSSKNTLVGEFDLHDHDTSLVGDRDSQGDMLLLDGMGSVRRKRSLDVLQDSISSTDDENMRSDSEHGGNQGQVGTSTGSLVSTVEIATIVDNGGSGSILKMGPTPYDPNSPKSANKKSVSQATRIFTPSQSLPVRHPNTANANRLDGVDPNNPKKFAVANKPQGRVRVKEGSLETYAHTDRHLGSVSKSANVHGVWEEEGEEEGGSKLSKVNVWEDEEGEGGFGLGVWEEDELQGDEKKKAESEMEN